VDRGRLAARAKVVAHACGALAVLSLTGADLGEGTWPAKPG
jgi:hypothetical protein